MISCTLTPYGLAFPDELQNSLSFSIFLYVIDFFFFIDIILNYFSAYVDDSEIIVDNFKSIAINYIKTWFFIDFISIMPID